MKKLFPFVVLFLAVFLAACNYNPIDIAKADNSRILTAQEAAEVEQARRIRAEQWSQTLLVVKASMPTIVFATELTTIALALGLSVSFVGTGAGVGAAGYGLGKVAVRAAEVRANLVHMDVKTRTFPLVLNYIKGTQGRLYSCHNANTESTVVLDKNHPADAELIQGIKELTRAGMVAFEVAGHASNEDHVEQVRTLTDQFIERVNRHETVPANR